jgi:hypothetical protein
LRPGGGGPHHLDVPTDAWTLDTLTGDLHQELAPIVARRGLRFVLYHEGAAWLDPEQARRVKRVLVRALSSAIGVAAAGATFRVDVTCAPAAGGRWLQTHATADGGTALWLSIPLEG